MGFDMLDHTSHLYGYYGHRGDKINNLLLPWRLAGNLPLSSAAAPGAHRIQALWHSSAARYGQMIHRCRSVALDTRTTAVLFGSTFFLHASDLG
jgi:hypothetical protein